MRASPRTALLLLIASVAAIKIGLQWSVPGFLQGDDVETMEAAFRAAFGLEYDDWEIRSHLLSELAVAPVLRAAAAIAPGIGSDGLLLAASLPFVLAGALATLLVVRLALRWGLSDREALAAAALYAVHAIAVVYGIGGFPRPLVAPLIVGAALLATREHWGAFFAAGLLVGLAGAGRYSEWMFLLPLVAMVLMGRDRRVTRVLLVLIGFAGGAVLVGAYDAVSGEGPFSSLIAFARYTLAGGSSSAEAAQPVWFYLARLHQWLPLTAVPLLMWGWGRWRRNALLWIALPLLVLSVVHHKELRYLQNVIPFVAIAIAATFWHASGVRRIPAILRPSSGVLGFTLLALTIVWAAWGVNRLERRSSSAVEAVRAIAAAQPARVALAQAWAYGNHLYLPGVHVVDLPVAPVAGDLERVRGADFVALYASTVTAGHRARLAELGFAPWREVAAGGRPVSLFRARVDPRRPLGYASASLD